MSDEKPKSDNLKDKDPESASEENQNENANSNKNEKDKKNIQNEEKKSDRNGAEKKLNGQSPSSPTTSHHSIKFDASHYLPEPKRGEFRLSTIADMRGTPSVGVISQNNEIQSNVDDYPIEEVKKGVDLSHTNSPIQFQTEKTTNEPNQPLDTPTPKLLDPNFRTNGGDRRFTRNFSSESLAQKLKLGQAFVYMVMPLDGGYGWFIVLISFLTQVIVDGIIFSIGTHMPHIQKDLNVSQSHIIFLSALQISSYFLSGPFASAFINKFGFRKVAASGATGAICVLLIASFCRSLTLLFIFYSILGGTMLSQIWVSSQLIIGYYFEKYRSIANGLSCSGAGAGFFAFTKLNTVVIPIIGWQNNIRLYAAWVAVALLLTLAFKEVKPTKIGIMREHEEASDSDSPVENEVVIRNQKLLDPAKIETNQPSADYFHIQTIPSNESQEKSSRKKQKCRNCLRCCKRKKTIAAVKEKDDDDEGHKRYLIQGNLFDKPDLFYTGPPQYEEVNTENLKDKISVVSGVDLELLHEDVAFAQVRYTLPGRPEGKSTMQEPRCCGCVKLSCSMIPRKMKSAFYKLFDFQLFRIMEFRILWFSAFFFALGMNIPFLFSTRRTTLPKADGSLVPLMIGTSNFISRIISGFLAFKLRPYVVYMCGSAIAIGGINVIISAFYGEGLFWYQMMYGLIFGIAPGCYSTLRAIIYVEYLGLPNLTNAFGLIAMGMGMGLFLGTALCGIMNSVTDSYFLTFIFSGTCVLTSGLLKISLPTLAKKKKQRRFTIN